MQSFILIIHIILAVLLIALILVQQGKGADAGAAFGSGASSTVFGAKGSATFITKITTFVAIVFFITSLSLAYFAASKGIEEKSIVPSSPSVVPDSTSIDKNKDLP